MPSPARSPRKQICTRQNASKLKEEKAEKHRKALAEIKNGVQSVRGAAKAHDISEGVLRGQLVGRKFMEDTGKDRTILNEVQEKVLVSYILAQETSNFGLTMAEVRHKANVLLNMHRRPDDSPREVGINWVSRFCKRHDSLQCYWNRGTSFQKAVALTPGVLEAYFANVSVTVPNSR